MMVASTLVEDWRHYRMGNHSSAVFLQQQLSSPTVQMAVHIWSLRKQ